MPCEFGSPLDLWKEDEFLRADFGVYGGMYAFFPGKGFSSTIFGYLSGSGTGLAVTTSPI